MNFGKRFRDSVKISVIFLGIGVLLGVWVGYAASPSSTFTISSGIYPGAPAYTIWEEDGTYYSKNAYGYPGSSGTDKTIVIQNANNALTSGGLIWLKDIQMPSTVTLSADVFAIELYGGELKIYKRDHTLGYPEKYFTDDVKHQAWMPNCYPVAIYYENKTYVAWHGTDSDPYITYYDHNLGIWANPVRIGDNPLTDGSDAHGTPSIIINSTGYFYVFYGGHGGHTNIQWAVSTNPKNITSWIDKGDWNAGALYTYPRLLNIGGNLYCFVRKSATPDAPIELYRKSTDGGVTWSGENIIIDLSDAVDTWALYGWAPQYDSSNNRIHIIWNDYNETDAPPYRNNYNHAYLSLADHKMYSMDDTDLGTTITFAEATANCKFIDSGLKGTSDRGFMHLNPSDYPYVVYHISRGDDPEAHDVYDLKFIKWTGAAWSAPVKITTVDDMCDGVDFIIHDANNIELFLVTNGSDLEGRGKGYMEYAGGDLEKWTTTDGGAHWSRIEIILSESSIGMPLALPRVPVDYQDDLKLVVSTTLDIWNDYSVFGKCYAYGDDGFVHREWRR